MVKSRINLFFFSLVFVYSTCFPYLLFQRNENIYIVSERLTYRWPGLLQSDDAALLESSSSSFDVAIEPVVVCASPPPGDKAVSVFGLNNVIGWLCPWWWWWCVLAPLPPLLLPLIIVAVGHDVNVFVDINCVSVMGSIWKHLKDEKNRKRRKKQQQVNWVCGWKR